MKITFNFLLFLCYSLLTVSNSENISFNKAVNFYLQSDFSSSKKEFLKCKNMNDTILKAEIYFYFGNINFKEQKYFEAIDNYKNVLRLNSEFYEAKNNLALARLKLLEKNKNNSEKNETNQQNSNEIQLRNDILQEAKSLENKALEKMHNTVKDENNFSRKIKNW